jgi:hypothetical protein
MTALNVYGLVPVDSGMRPLYNLHRYPAPFKQTIGGVEVTVPGIAVPVLPLATNDFSKPLVYRGGPVYGPYSGTLSYWTNKLPIVWSHHGGTKSGVSSRHVVDRQSENARWFDTNFNQRFADQIAFWLVVTCDVGALFENGSPPTSTYGSNLHNQLAGALHMGEGTVVYNPTTFDDAMDYIEGNPLDPWPYARLQGPF